MLTSSSPPILLSAESALSWEFWNRFRRQLPLTLMAMCLPPLVVGLFRRGGQWMGWLRYQEWISLGSLPAAFQLAALTVQLAAVLLVLLALAPLSRAYVLPVATRSLFRRRVAQATTGACIAMVLATGISNAILGTNWPYRAPILFAAVAVAAALWIAVEFRGREWWIGGVGTAAAAVLFLCLRRNFLDSESRAWEEEPFSRFALMDALTLAAALVVLWSRTLYVGELDRCAARETNREPMRAAAATVRHDARALPLRSSWRAMLSWEWRLNGWLFPLAIVVSAFIGYGTALSLSIRDFRQSGAVIFPTEFINPSFIFLVGFFIFAYGALFQVVTTSAGRRLLAGHRPESWPLTLPASNQKIGYVSLSRSLLSALAAAAAWWLIGLLHMGIIQVYLRIQGAGALADGMLEELSWRHWHERQLTMAVIMLGTVGWTLAGVVEASILSGRRWIALLPPAGLFLLILTLTAIELVFRTTDFLTFNLLALSAAGALGALVAAVRSGELGWRGAAGCVGLWIATAIVLDLARLWDLPTGLFQHELLQSRASALMLLATTCVTLPITLPPLAVGWNRSR